MEQINDTFEINRKALKRTKGKPCPCKVQKTDANICPCEEFLSMGKCVCGIFKR